MIGVRFLLDTNVIIGLDNGNATARQLVSDHGANPEVCAVSQITRMELLSFHSLTPEEHIR